MPLPLEGDAEYVPPQDSTQEAELRANTAQIAAGAKGSPGREDLETVGSKEESTTEEDHYESLIVTEEQPPPERRPESAAQVASEEEYVIDRVVDRGYVDGNVVLPVHWYGYPESEET